MESKEVETMLENILEIFVLFTFSLHPGDFNEMKNI